MPETLRPLTPIYISALANNREKESEAVKEIKIAKRDVLLNPNNNPKWTRFIEKKAQKLAIVPDIKPIGNAAKLEWKSLNDDPYGFFGSVSPVSSTESASPEQNSLDIAQNTSTQPSPSLSPY